eukprot:m.403777 g.403777  ORF g.403777 m.403777 type:complete len:771 (+) comp16790_c1_seq11:20517-22829(+)
MADAESRNGEKTSESEYRKRKQFDVDGDPAAPDGVLPDAGAEQRKKARFDTGLRGRVQLDVSQAAVSTDTGGAAAAAACTPRSPEAEVEDVQLEIGSRTMEEDHITPHDDVGGAGDGKSSGMVAPDPMKPREWSKASDWLQTQENWKSLAPRFERLSGSELCDYELGPLTTKLGNDDGPDLYMHLQKFKSSAAPDSDNSTISIEGRKIRLTDGAQKLEIQMTEATEPVLGDLVTISHLKEAGLSEHQQWDFYTRRAMWNQWVFLKEASTSRGVRQLGDVAYHNLLLIGGPPGSGKSTTTWHWCCAQAKTEPILWIHKSLGDGGAFNVCLLTKDCVFSFKNLLKVADVEATVNEILVKGCVNICVFDGVTADADQEFKTLLASWQTQERSERMLIYCASVAVVLKFEAGYKDHQVFSWTLDEYATACTNDTFWNNVKSVLSEVDEHAAPADGKDSDEDAGSAAKGDEDALDDDANDDGANDDGDSENFLALPLHRRLAIKHKFYIAGHCARWMFGATPKQAVADVKNHVKQLDSIHDLLREDMGESANRQVNHLRASLPTGPTFTSKFVARELALQRRDVNDSFIKTLNEFAIKSGNPSFEGWCLEFDFLSQVRAALHPSKDLLSIGDGHWPVRKILQFTNESDVAGFKLEAGTWLIPTRWNQSTFDAVMFASTKTDEGATILEVLPCQVTRASKHAVKSPALYRLTIAVDAAVQDLSSGQKRPFQFRFVRPRDLSRSGFDGQKPTKHGAFFSRAVYRSSVVFFNRRLPVL